MTLVVNNVAKRSGNVKEAAEVGRQRRKTQNIPNTATKFSKLLASRFDVRIDSKETMPGFSENISDVGVVTLAAGGVQPACSSTDICERQP